MAGILKIHKGLVRSGKFIPDTPQEWSIAYCAHEGRRVGVIVDRERKQGTQRQRGYYWAVIVPILSEITGYTEREAHDALKWEHLRVRRDRGPDTVKSTESLSTVEKEEYYEKCRRTITALGGFCPLPNEVME